MLRIDMTRKRFETEDIPAPYFGLGGRALSSHVIAREVPPKADPLGSENKLVFAAGIAAGTRVPNSGRLSVGAKSPLTNAVKEANVGGAAAQKLARLGIQAVVVEGCAPEPVIVKITKEGVKFMPAGAFQGMGNYGTVERLKTDNGDSAAIVSIGPAGELRLKAASVAVTTPDFQIRMAGRGGLGAVMGSKGLKALVIDDTGCGQVEVADRGKLKEAAAALSKGIVSHGLVQGLKQLGTPLLVMAINGLGALPTRNFSMGRFAAAEKISGERLAELMKLRPNSRNAHRCMEGCIIGCSNFLTDQEGKTIVSGLEYETLGLVGANCMIDDLDTIARINAVCNDAGVDTIDIGGALAMHMEAGLVAWGDGEAALRLVEEIPKGSEKGMTVGNGCLFAGEVLGVKRIPQVKGQGMAAYDPRVLKGTGVTYATSPMGADHTCGNALPSPANPAYNPSDPAGQGQMSQFLQTYFAAIDSIGLCLFASVPTLDMPELQRHLIDCISAIQGKQLEEDYFLRLGASVLRAEKTFNERAGLTKESDRLPRFFLEEPLSASAGVFDVPQEDIDAVHAAFKGV